MFTSESSLIELAFCWLERMRCKKKSWRREEKEGLDLKNEEHSLSKSMLTLFMKKNQFSKLPSQQLLVLYFWVHNVLMFLWHAFRVRFTKRTWPWKFYFFFLPGTTILLFFLSMFVFVARLCFRGNRNVSGFFLFYFFFNSSSWSHRKRWKSRFNERFFTRTSFFIFEDEPRSQSYQTLFFFVFPIFAVKLECL